MISLPYGSNQVSLFGRKPFVDDKRATIPLDLATLNESTSILGAMIKPPPLVGLGFFLASTGFYFLAFMINDFQHFYNILLAKECSQQVSFQR